MECEACEAKKLNFFIWLLSSKSLYIQLHKLHNSEGTIKAVKLVKPKD